MLPPPQTIRRPSIWPRHPICPRGRAVASSEVRHAEHRASKTVPATVALCGMASLRVIENERINERRAYETGSSPSDATKKPRRLQAGQRSSAQGNGMPMPQLRPSSKSTSTTKRPRTRRGQSLVSGRNAGHPLGEDAHIDAIAGFRPRLPPVARLLVGAAPREVAPAS
jgi:hypothetical protein